MQTGITLVKHPPQFLVSEKSRIVLRANSINGKSHSSHEKEEDIARLCMSYHASKIHTNRPRRKLGSKDKVLDTMCIGAESNKLIKTMSKTEYQNGRMQRIGRSIEST